MSGVLGSYMAIKNANVMAAMNVATTKMAMNQTKQTMDAVQQMMPPSSGVLNTRA